MAKLRRKTTVRTNRTNESLKERVVKNYKSLLLGLFSLVVVLLLLLKLVPFGKTPSLNQQNDTPTVTQTQQIPESNTTQKGTTGQKSYTVKEGDSLWSIAQETYGSGYNAYDIAEANKLVNASEIEIGQKLIIPSVKAKEPTVGEITPVAASTEEKGGQIAKQSQSSQPMASTTYVIKPGDYLWKIATEVYGDGYQWTRIAQANNLENPSLIHVDNILQIPR